MKIKLNLDPAEAPDLELIAQTLKNAVDKDEISSEELGYYITTTLISLCVQGLALFPEEAEALDQAAAITLMKSMME